jgi:hypothetical protein
MILSLPRLGGVLRIAGTSAGIALATVGLVAQPAAALGGALAVGFATGVVALWFDNQPGLGTPVRRRCVIRAGGTAVRLWLIGTGLVVLLGPSTASVLVALLVVGVPGALLVQRALRPVQAAPTAPRVRIDVQSPVLATLSTPELCLAWRRSYFALGELPSGPARGELVTLRQSMLDEIERRDPAGFQRWLDAGARAGSDPGRYLATGPGG